jgi:glycosyltransferase involved in cell wall biosynthesis
MTENTPVKQIPVPDYDLYKFDLCSRYNITLPLQPVPFFPDGMLKYLPDPVNSQKKGWPWTMESAITFTAQSKCPKLSVVIPSYQQGRYIEETIRSVLLQNYPNVELIIMDGNSTDETQAILEHYKNFISLTINENDRGQSHAINKGFAMADGEIFYWLNSDDFLTLNSINKVMLLFQSNLSLDIIYGDGVLLDQVTGKSSPAFAPLVFERYLRFGGIVLSHSVLWRKRVHCPVWEDLNCAMDAELWLRLFSGKKTKHAHFPIGVFRMHPKQKTSDQESWSKKWAEDFDLFIWEHYSPINKLKWKWRSFEFRMIQKMHHFLFYKLPGITKQLFFVSTLFSTLFIFAPMGYVMTFKIFFTGR